MAVDTLTGSFLMGIGWNASKSRTGLTALDDTGNSNKTFTFTHGTGAGQANEPISYVHTIPAGGTVSIDLSGSLSNVLNDSSITVTKIKAIEFWLLSATDDAAVGTACSGVTIGNSAANGCKMFMSNVTMTFDLNNGEKIGFGTPGTGLTVTAGTADLVKVVNNDGAVAAKLRITGLLVG